MTKKDYKLIAAALFHAKPSPEVKHYSTALDAWQATIVSIAQELKRDNSAFDIDKFVDACHES